MNGFACCRGWLYKFVLLSLILEEAGVTTSTKGFTAVIGYSQYLIMSKHLSKELAEPMNINWKTSSQVSTGLRMDKCQSSNIIINNVKDKLKSIGNLATVIY